MQSAGAKPDTCSSCACLASSPVLQLGLGLSAGSSCDVAQVTMEEGSNYPELGPQAGLVYMLKACLTGRTGLAKSLPVASTVGLFLWH